MALWSVPGELQGPCKLGTQVWISWKCSHLSLNTVLCPPTSFRAFKESRHWRGTSLTLAQRGEVHLISTELLEIASSLQTVFLLGAQRSWSQGLAELALGLISTGGHCVNATHLAGPCWDLSRTLHVLCPGSLSNLKWNCTERKTPWRHLRHDKMTVLYKKWQPLRWK